MSPTPFINPTTLPTIFRPANNFRDIASLLNTLVPNLLIGAGLILFIMLIYGGFKYMSSGGNPESLKKAQDIFKYIAIGFVLVIASMFLVRLISSIFNIRSFL